MLKKFWSYQKLLQHSGGFANEKKSSKLIVISLYFFAFILNFILDRGGILFFGVIISLYSGYHIINSQSRLFESVPVSKLYSFINIYSYGYVTSFLGLVTFIVVLPFEMLVVYATDLNLDETYVIQFFYNWRAILLTGSIAIIIVSILLPIFFVRINALRKTLTISVITLATIGIISFKNTLPVIDRIGEVNFLESLKIINYYNNILLILVCICVVAVPISILISYRLYKGKRCKIQ